MPQTTRNVPRSRKIAVFERDGWKCVYCGCAVIPTKPHCTEVFPNTATVDHVIPAAHGGPHHMGNLVTACNLCNNRRGSHINHLVQTGVWPTLAAVWPTSRCSPPAPLPESAESAS